MVEGDFTAEVRRYLDDEALPGGPPESVGFLARGEYSLNYLARGEKYLVVRLVTGSQIGLPLEEQAPYEHHALQLLAPSSVTPKPYHVDPDPESLPYPLIVEEYLPGRPLNYATDVPAAARCVAEIHALGVPEDHHLQLHPDPAPAILAETSSNSLRTTALFSSADMRGLLSRYPRNRRSLPARRRASHPPFGVFLRLLERH